MAMSPGHHAHNAAVIWVDGWHALVAHNVHGRAIVTELDREAQPMHEFLMRVGHEADDCDRLMILGPDGTRTAFEHEYADLYHRSDRFIEAEAAAPTTDRELLDRLHFLDPDERRA